VTSPSLLVLVRHGESTWLAEGRFQGRGDVPLTDRGRRQATALGARLAAPAAPPALPIPDTAPLAIWHSPLRRAAETAQAIHEAREADAPLRPLETLLELSQGEWEGLSQEEVHSHYPRQLASWLDDPIRNHAPGGESLPVAFERAQRAVRAILADPDPDASTAFAPMTAASRSMDRRASPARPRRSASGPPELVLGYAPAYDSGHRPAWAVVVAHDGILRCLLLGLLHLGLEHFWAFPFALAAISTVEMTGSRARLRALNLDEHLSVVGVR
jgi:broad specificity phosphatase PhoE